MNKIAFLSDRLYVPQKFVLPQHLEAYTDRFDEHVTDSSYDKKACRNCTFWQKPWVDSKTGKKQLCHLLGYTSEDVCDKFDPKVRRIVQEVTVEHYAHRDDGTVSFIRGDLGKVAQVFHDFEIVDQRVKPPLGFDLHFKDQYSLRPDQVGVVRKWIRHGYGILKAPTGCITGDALIGTNRAGLGRPMTLEHVVKMFNGEKTKGPAWRKDIDTFVRAPFSDGRVRLAKLLDARRSGVKSVFKVVLDNGVSVTATSDHRFLTSHGWIELQNLSPGSDVFVDGGIPTKSKLSKKNYKVTVLREHPFAGRRGVNPKKGGWSVPVHRLVAEARLNEMSLDDFKNAVRSRQPNLKFIDPKVWAVHHKNENTLDNSPENLEVLTHADHQKAHRQTSLDNIEVRLIPSKVISIETAGEQETYDLEVEGAEAFMANNIAVHNSGKSVMISYIMSLLQTPTLILSHETRHLRNLEEEIRKFTNVTYQEESLGRELVGWIERGKGDYPITLSTFQSFSSKLGKVAIESYRDKFGFVVNDECVAPGTMVGGKPIEAVEVGDLVPAMHPELGFVHRRVVRVFKSKATSLRTISTDRMRSLSCNDVHPIFVTGRGYVHASSVVEGDYVRTAAWIIRDERVFNIEVHEPGDDGTFGGRCPEGVVYNLEVEDAHTFFANGILTHNCHHESAATYHTVFNTFNAYHRMGTTATPTRRDKLHCSVYHSIGPVVAEGGNAQLKCRVQWVPTGINIPPHLKRFKYPMPMMHNWIEKQPALKELLLEKVLDDISNGRRPLIISERVKLVHWLQRQINASGYTAELVIGGTVTDSFSELSQKLIDGRVHCVIGTKVMNENVNIPPLDTLHLPFPSHGTEVEEQRAGRIRRPVPSGEAWTKLDEPIIYVYCYEGISFAKAHERVRRDTYVRLGFMHAGEAVAAGRNLAASLDDNE